MANEIRIQSSLSIKNGNFDGAWSATFQADQAGIGGGNPGTVDLTTTEAEIDFGDIDSEGWCWIKNIGDTNAAQVSPVAFRLRQAKPLARFG